MNQSSKTKRKNKFSKLQLRCSNNSFTKCNSPQKQENISKYFPPLIENDTVQETSLETPFSLSIVQDTVQEYSLETPLSLSIVQDTNNTNEESDFETPKLPKTSKLSNISKEKQKKTLKKTNNGRGLVTFGDKLSCSDTNTEQLQLVIAMSKSLHESEHPETEIVYPSTQEKLAVVKSTLEQFGFKSKQPIRQISQRQSTRRKFNKFITPTLFLRKDEDRLTQIEDRVSQILINISIYNETNDENSQILKQNNMTDDHKPKSFLLRDYYSAIPIVFHKNALSLTEMNDNQLFYTNIISTTNCKSGVLLRDWHKIPGREFTPEPEKLLNSSNRSSLFIEEKSPTFAENKSSFSREKSPTFTKENNSLNTSSATREKSLKSLDRSSLFVEEKSPTFAENSPTFAENKSSFSREKSPIFTKENNSLNTSSATREKSLKSSSRSSLFIEEKSPTFAENKCSFSREKSPIFTKENISLNTSSTTREKSLKSSNKSLLFVEEMSPTFAEHTSNVSGNKPLEESPITSSRENSLNNKANLNLSPELFSDEEIHVKSGTIEIFSDSSETKSLSLLDNISPRRGKNKRKSRSNQNDEPNSISLLNLQNKSARKKLLNQIDDEICHYESFHHDSEDLFEMSDDETQIRHAKNIFSIETQQLQVDQKTSNENYYSKDSIISEKAKNISKNTDCSFGKDFLEIQSKNNLKSIPSDDDFYVKNIHEDIFSIETQQLQQVDQKTSKDSIIISEKAKNISKNTDCSFGKDFLEIPSKNNLKSISSDDDFSSENYRNRNENMIESTKNISKNTEDGSFGKDFLEIPSKNNLKSIASDDFSSENFRNRNKKLFSEKIIESTEDQNENDKIVFSENTIESTDNKINREKNIRNTNENQFSEDIIAATENASLKNTFWNDPNKSSIIDLTEEDENSSNSEHIFSMQTEKLRLDNFQNQNSDADDEIEGIEPLNNKSKIRKFSLRKTSVFSQKFACESQVRCEELSFNQFQSNDTNLNGKNIRSFRKSSSLNNITIDGTKNVSYLSQKTIETNKKEKFCFKKYLSKFQSENNTKLINKSDEYDFNSERNSRKRNSLTANKIESDYFDSGNTKYELTPVKRKRYDESNLKNKSLTRSFSENLIPSHNFDLEELNLDRSFDAQSIDDLDSILSDEELNYSCRRPNANVNDFENNSDDEEIEEDFTEILKHRRITEIHQTENDIIQSGDHTPKTSKTNDLLHMQMATPKFNDVVVKTRNITPLPHYSDMDSPERHCELEKFGLKPMKRTDGIKMLKYIYEATHPRLATKSDDRNSSSDNEIGKNQKMTHDDCFRKRRKTRNLSETIEDLQLIDGNIEILGDKIANSETMEEMIFERRHSKKYKSCRLPFHIAWHNFLSTEKQLREKILLYEPIQIEEIYQQFKALGFQYHIKDIISFLDRKCITIKIAQKPHQRMKK